jgi:hypothetical protein
MAKPTRCILVLVALAAFPPQATANPDEFYGTRALQAQDFQPGGAMTVNNTYSWEGQGTHAAMPELVAPRPEERSAARKYFEMCEAELGKFPADVINCSDATEIPVIHTDADGFHSQPFQWTDRPIAVGAIALGTAVLNPNTITTAAPHGLTTGMGPIRITTGLNGVLPTLQGSGQINTNTNYWVIRDADDRIKLATTHARALTKTAEVFTNAGTLALNVVLSMPDSVPEILGLEVTAVTPAQHSLTIANHGLVNGYGPVRFSRDFTAAPASVLPAGLAEGRDYWVMVTDANTIQLSAAAGPLARVTITDAGTGPWRIIPTGLGAQITDANAPLKGASCDKPSLIYRDTRNVGCLPQNRMRRVTTDFDWFYDGNLVAQAGTVSTTVDWIYICRKSNKFFTNANLYQEIALIGYNRTTGKTCFYAGTPIMDWPVTNNAGLWTRTVVGVLPGQTIPRPDSTNERSTYHWTVPGGTNGCVRCHSHGPWIKMPFNDIRQPDADGEPVIPYRQPGMLYDPVLVQKEPAFRTFVAETLAGKRPFIGRTQMAALVVSPANQHKLLVQLGLLGLTEGNANAAETDNPPYLAHEADGTPRAANPWIWNFPKKLMAPEARPCTMCHHIGNWDYGRRLPDTSIFLADAGTALPQVGTGVDQLNARARLYFDNLAPFLGTKNRSDVAVTPLNPAVGPAHATNYQLLGFHNFRLRGAARENQRVEYGYQVFPQRFMRNTPAEYATALTRIKRCLPANGPGDLGAPIVGCSWSNHFSLESFEKDSETERYLVENCGSCHSGADNTPQPRITSAADMEAEFTRNGAQVYVAARMMARIDDGARPMPPQGQFEELVQNIIQHYLSARLDKAREEKFKKRGTVGKVCRTIGWALSLGYACQD